MISKLPGFLLLLVLAVAWPSLAPVSFAQDTLDPATGLPVDDDAEEELGAIGSSSLTGEVEIVMDTRDPAMPVTQVGLGGVVRPRYWTPMRVVLSNRLNEPKTVAVEWALEDADGDEMYSRREVTLTPGRAMPQVVWLYAAVPARVDPTKINWRVRVFDVETGQLLAVAPNVRPAFDGVIDAAISPRMIGLLGRPGMNLAAYREDWTQQEPTNFVPLTPSDLPDRWFGYAAADALIWTGDGPNPNDPSMTPGTYRALEQWIRRGGHLVVVLPVSGRTWFNSPLGDLFPDVGVEEVPDQDLPAWLGTFLFAQNVPKMPVLAFDPRGNADVLLTDNADRPIVVASQLGFGRVTVMGIDLTDPRLARAKAPEGVQPWQTIFGWRGPAYTAAQIQAMRDDPEQTIQSPPGAMGRRGLGRFVIGATGMTATAGSVLFLAVLVFAVYWLVAGPLSYMVLRRMELERHSWLIFAGLVLVFVLFTWAGAALLRPAKTSVQHVTVLDINGRDGSIHAHSWLSLFVPTHGATQISVLQEDEQESAQDVISTAGLRRELGAGDFINRQRYTFEAASPDSIDVPMRSTAKQLEIDYMSTVSHLEQTVGEGWGSIRGQVKRQGYNLHGALTHDLPGELRYVKILLLGDAATARVWTVNEWKPGMRVDLPLARPAQLAPTFRSDTQAGTTYGASHLSSILNTMQPGADMEQGMLSEEEIAALKLSDSDIFQGVELLTFFDYLPPPLFRVESYTWPTHYNRAIGRELNLSHFVPINCVMVIGYMKNSELPIPLRVDGDEIPSDGWTIVRWILPLGPREQPSSQNVFRNTNSAGDDNASGDLLGGR